MADAELLDKQLRYYRRRLDELAGENLSKDYEISGLRKEVKQKRRAFELLTQLQESIGAEKEIAEIFERAIQSINATIGMDRTVVLRPGERKSHYQPAHWTGFDDHEAEHRLAAASVALPDELCSEGGFRLVHRKSEPDDLIVALREAVEVRYFACVPVILEGRTIGVLLSGRLKEAGTLFPPIDQGDVETLRAIAGLISAVIRNVRVGVLEEMDRLKTQFFANISHELRTPLTLTIGPISGLLAGRYGDLPEPARDQLDVMLRNQHRLLSLINQILDLDKLESGKMELRARRVADLEARIQQTVGPFRPLAAHNDIAIHVTCDPAVAGAALYADPALLFDRMLFNLLSNAIKYTRQGSISVTAEVQSEHICISVTDTGIGIKADQLPKIFDRFQQADGSASREYAGTGLGLSLVKEIIELHHGDIDVYSEYGRGTTFTTRVPIGKAHLPPSAVVDHPGGDTGDGAAPVAVAVELNEGVLAADVSDTNARARQRFVDGRPWILYVDDNADLRRWVQDLLLPRYNVLVAADGAAGLDALRGDDPFDLILSDVMMPRMTGIELCRQVRDDALLRELPLVLLTARTTMESRIEGLEVGADDYLNKPFSEAELLARVNNLLLLRQHQRRLKRELRAARDIQQAILPAHSQTLHGVRLDVLYRPCEELSGDSFDVIESDGWTYLYLADVTSHGTASAQVTYIIQRLFRAALQAHPGQRGSDLLRHVAADYRALHLRHDVGIQVYRFLPGGAQIECTRGNAPSAVLVRDGAPSLVDTRPGPGLLKGGSSDWHTHAMTLQAGDAVFAFTDGAYEFIAQGRRFGMKKLTRLLLAEPRPELATDWAQDVWTRLRAAGDPGAFDDDVTIIRLLV